MEYKTLTEIKEAIHSKKLSSCEITKYYLEKIKKYNNKIDNNKINPRDEKINFFDL